MLNAKKIEEELNKPNNNKTKVCSTAGIARSTLDKILKGGDLQVSTLEAIAKALNKPMGFFFDEEIELSNAGRDYVEKGKIEYHGTEFSGNSTTEAELREQIAQLKSQLADKERIIRLLEKSE